MVIYQDDAIGSLNLKTNGRWEFQYQHLFDDHLVPGLYRVKIKLLGKDRKTILKCVELKIDYVDLDNLGNLDL